MSFVWILNSLTCIDHDYILLYIMVSMQFDVNNTCITYEKTVDRICSVNDQSQRVHVAWVV